MSQPHPLAALLPLTAVVAMASCTPGPRPAAPARIPQRARDPRGYERVRAALLADLAAAIAQAIRDNDVQCLRERIQTGRERYAHDLRYRGNSMPYVDLRFADWFTGHVVAEIEAVVRKTHSSAVTRGINPQRIVLHGRPVVEYGDHVSCRMTSGGGAPLRLFFSTAPRRFNNGKCIMVLDGGGIFGGLCFAWLTDNELRDLQKGKQETELSYAARIAPLILRHRLRYRWVVLRSGLPYPDLLRQRYVNLAGNIANGYSGLNDDQRESLRTSLTYSHWASPYQRGEEYLRILFDESGSPSEVFVEGRRVHAPQSQEPRGQ